MKKKIDKNFVLNHTAYKKKFEKNSKKIEELENKIIELNKENKSIKPLCEGDCYNCVYKNWRGYNGGYSDAWCECELKDTDKKETLVNAGILIKYPRGNGFEYFIPKGGSLIGCIYYKPRESSFSWADR